MTFPGGGGGGGYRIEMRSKPAVLPEVPSQLGRLSDRSHIGGWH